MFRTLFLLILLLSFSAYGATLSGMVYDLDLDVVDKAIVEINTTPQQRMVTVNGTYTLELDPGSYRLRAYLSQGDEFNTEEHIVVPVSNGKYVLDLFLFYDFNDSSEDPLDLTVEEDLSWGAGTISIVVVLVILILIILVIIVLYGARKQTVSVSSVPEQREPLDTKLRAQVLDLLKTNNNMMTQKELRKRIPYSEAKISLIIKALEEEGIVTKQKQGLVNVLRLVKR